MILQFKVLKKSNRNISVAPHQIKTYLFSATIAVKAFYVY